jgi:hypothetical protein
MYLSDDIQVLLFKNNTPILYYICARFSSPDKEKSILFIAIRDKI